MPADTTDAEKAAEACIWRMDPGGLAASAPCDPRSWAGSVRHDLRAAGAAPDLTAQTEVGSPFLPCAAVFMVKNEADIIGTNLGWLHRLGVRRFVVMDNDSADGTWAALTDFQAAHSDAELLAIRDPIVAYTQARKVSGMCQLARSVWPDVQWLFPLDADEFLVTRHGLRALVYVPEDIQALTVPKMVHFRPLPYHAGKAGALLGGMSVRSAPWAVPPKVLVRARAELNVGQGNHKAELPNRRASYTGGFQYGFSMREFQTRSFEQFLAKVRHGGAAVLAANARGQPVGGEHWVAWHELLLQGGEAALREEYVRVAYRAPGNGYVKDPFEPRIG